MTRFIRILLVVITIGNYGNLSTANAAEMKALHLTANSDCMSITGEIKEGDALAFATFAATWASHNRNRRIECAVLDSPGGDVRSALLIADVIHELGIDTYVTEGSTCASACFFIFAAGKTRVASVGCRIGVHSMSEKAKETKASKYATLNVARVLMAAFKVPPVVIGKMVGTPPTSMAWLDDSDAREMGLIVINRVSK